MLLVRYWRERFTAVARMRRKADNVHLESNTPHILNEMPNTDRLTTGNFT